MLIELLDSTATASAPEADTQKIAWTWIENNFVFCNKTMKTIKSIKDSDYLLKKNLRKKINK